MKMVWLMCMVALSATACAGNNPAVTAALVPAAMIGTSVPCDSTTCKEDWERAQLWIVKHSRWKIQTTTDVLIETYNPVGYEPSYGFTVVREPAGGGSYSISMTMTCGNMFGCSPKPVEVQEAFYYYVARGIDLLSGFSDLGGIN